MTPSLGRIAVLGGGSWATALAKLLLGNEERILWYMRRPDRIQEFLKYGHNPVYLSDVTFDTDRISFSEDINRVISEADTLVLAVPSPYLLSHLEKVDADLRNKNIVSAVKGIVPEQNVTVTDYFLQHFGCEDVRMLAIGGPCHAEEVALERLSYLTIACHDRERALLFARSIGGKKLKTIISTDVEGLEYAAVLKNVYAIAGGIVHGMKTGDNFMAMLACNAAREMRRFIDAIAPCPRDICHSAYLGDLLVTAYSRFSRNHNFGSMIGKGYSVKAAMMEMEMVAEGYYATKCIHEINEAGPHTEMPILDCMFRILYEGVNPHKAIRAITGTFC